MKEYGHLMPPANWRGVRALSSKERMDDVEPARTMFRRESRDQPSPPPARGSNVVNASAK
jgi:hypothetical protein